jgi:NADH dehydrogenase [ubiquinone] 1 alpha subcomplex assembly factor 5
MNLTNQPPEIFDRRRRQAVRDRAGWRRSDTFMWSYIADDLAERLVSVMRTFEHVLIIGPVAAFQNKILGERQCTVSVAPLSASEAATSGSAVIEEDRQPFSPASFDLVISAGTLDSVNDLPGALVQIRRILKPDGLFLGHMFGAGTLATLKTIILAAEGDAASAHIHPQIDLRSAADLLTRAGFALPVADVDIMRVRYSDWRKIVADLRNAGLGNALSGQRNYLGKRMISRLDTEWGERTDASGKAEETFIHLHLSGWAPSPDQPKPAKRGSGQISLASILSPNAKP